MHLGKWEYTTKAKLSVIIDCFVTLLNETMCIDNMQHSTQQTIAIWAGCVSLLLAYYYFVRQYACVLLRVGHNYRNPGLCKPPDDDVWGNVLCESHQFEWLGVPACSQSLYPFWLQLLRKHCSLSLWCLCCLLWWARSPSYWIFHFLGGCKVLYSRCSAMHKLYILGWPIADHAGMQTHNNSP